MKDRIYELDFIRGVAIILMILFHFIVDLNQFCNFNIPYDYGFWFYIGKISAILFILISGIISSIKTSRIFSGIRLLLLGVLLSLITMLYSRHEFIKFGILHFIGLSIIITSYIKTEKKALFFVVGTIIIYFGITIKNYTVNTRLLFPLGFKYKNFYSLDYYPIFPWYGVFIYGIGLGKIFYKKRNSLFTKALKNNIFIYLGRHSLIIYLMHQPILFLLIYIFHNI